MKDREATRAIRALAERQHGIVARRQLIECGVGEWLNQGRAEAGLLIPVFRGVFALGHRRIGREGRWMAAVLASGPGAVLSHGSAMELWGLRGSRGPTEVLRPAGGPRQKRSDIRLHQTRSLPGEHVTTESGIPVTRSSVRCWIWPDAWAKSSWSEHWSVLIEAVAFAGRSCSIWWCAVEEGRGSDGCGGLQCR